MGSSASQVSTSGPERGLATGLPELTRQGGNLPSFLVEWDLRYLGRWDRSVRLQLGAHRVAFAPARAPERPAELKPLAHPP